VCDGNYYALAVTERLGVEESDGMVQVGIGHYNTIMLFPFWQQADNRYLAACTIFILHEIATRCFKLLVEPFAFFTAHDQCLDIERLIADFDFGFRPVLQIEIPTRVPIHTTPGSRYQIVAPVYNVDDWVRIG
jgi:hypothetical protein